jgi:hypothetical protein
MDVQEFAETINAPRALLHFSGWPDAGDMIEFTLNELKNLVPIELVAQWDLDGFWQTDTTRPVVHLQHGQVKRLEWPFFRFFEGRYADADPFLIGTGVEPARNWRGFTVKLLGLLKQWGCREIILLGSLYDQIFHDEVLISSVVQDVQGYNKILELGCRPGEYVGPGSIHSAIMEATQGGAMRCLSLWTHLPFYLQGPHERVSARCLEIIGALLGFTLDPLHLRQRWEEREGDIEELIHNNHELRQAIEVLKKDRHRRQGDFPSKVVRMDDFMKKKHDPRTDEE